jgi:phosphoglycolate phosphatase-like HAD superfamily hydrolase
VSTYILWDIDGTLILGNQRAGALYGDAIEQVTGVRPTTRLSDPHGMTEGQLLMEVLAINGIDTSQVPAVLARLDELSLAQHESGENPREAAPGTAAAIAAFAQRGWVNAVLTGNGPNRARYKVLAAGYRLADFDWEHSYFGHESPTRHHLTADAAAALVGQRVVIIGDTPKDGEAADSAGFPFVAVATGAFTADELRASSAVLVVEDFASGLDAAIEAIESVAASA